MTAWIQISVEVAAALADSCSAQLEALGAVAVTLGGAGDDDVLEPLPGEQPLWSAVRLDALFDLDAELTAIRERLQVDGARVVDVTLLQDADWQERWRAHAVRRLFGERLWVIPRDEVMPDTAGTATAEAAVLRLDPGLAFGTGAHPTTRLCLERLAALPLAGKRVLDYGCGSGILGLAACLLGARSVTAIDHDPQALAATLENAAWNGIEADRLRVADPAALAEPANGHDRFDVIVANILANPLIELAPHLTGLAAPGAELVLSGLLADQEAPVRAAYPRVRFEPAVADEDWIRLDGTVG
jgi:ribosomal protein L11 methyltransferase